MLQHWLFLTCCIVAVACLFQDVEGSQRCLMRCKYRCRMLQNKLRRTAYWTCARKCTRMAQSCESCFGPNKCLKCASGYEQSLGPYCVANIKKCSTKNGGCSAHAVCTGNPGSVNCTCNPGFTGNGKTCYDIDECATDNGGCPNFAICTNSIGSFTCECNTGYTGNGTVCTGWGLMVDLGTAFGPEFSAASMYIYTSVDFNFAQDSNFALMFPMLLVPGAILSTFLVLPCLAPDALATAPASRCVSFMPEFLPGYYLHMKDFDALDGSSFQGLVYEERIIDATFDQNASFIMHKDLFKPGGYVSFQSVSNPTLYMYAGLAIGIPLVLCSVAGSFPEFNNYASFKLVPAWSPSYIPPATGGGAV